MSVATAAAIVDEANIATWANSPDIRYAAVVTALHTDRLPNTYPNRTTKMTGVSTLPRGDPGWRRARMR